MDDGAAQLFAGTDLVEAVSARPRAGAWWVDSDAGEVTETPLEVRGLPARDDGRPPLAIAEFRRARAPVLGRSNRPARRAAGIGD